MHHACSECQFDADMHDTFTSRPFRWKWPKLTIYRPADTRPRAMWNRYTFDWWENLPAPDAGPCALCNHDPAHGFATITIGDTTRWYCHADCHDAPTTCYESASLLIVQARAMHPALAALIDEVES